MEVDDTVSPPGFGACGRCRFAARGDVATCARCAATALGSLTDAHVLADGPGGLWRPPDPAGVPLADAWAVARYGPLIAVAIHKYKTGGRRGWARIFARLLLARLEQLGHCARRYELIIANPTYVGDGGRRFDHTGLVLACAEDVAPGRWPFVRGVISRTGPVPALKDCRGWRSRAEIARTQLRAALEVIDPERVRGASVLIFDDVMTTGATCHAVARALLEAGAVRAGAIVLARQSLG